MKNDQVLLQRLQEYYSAQLLKNQNMGAPLVKTIPSFNVNYYNKTKL